MLALRVYVGARLSTMLSLASTAFDYFRVLRPHKGTLLATCAFVVVAQQYRGEDFESL